MKKRSLSLCYNKDRLMKLEETITFAIMSDGHGKMTDQIAVAINRNGWHIRKDVMPEKIALL